MRTLLKILVLVPVAVLGVAFAVANRRVVGISFDPFSDADPAFALAAPLFLLVFILLMTGVVIGGAAAWLGQARHRRAARHRQAEIDALRTENDRLKTEIAIKARRVTESRASLPALMLHDAD